MEGGRMEEKIIGSRSAHRDEITKAMPFYMTTVTGFSVHEPWIFRMKQKCQESLTKRSVVATI